MSPDLPSGDLSPALSDLDTTVEELQSLEGTGVAFALSTHDEGAERDAGLAEQANQALADGGTLLVWVAGVPDASNLASWRDALWPTFHVAGWYGFTTGKVKRHALSGSEHVGESTLTGALMVAKRRTEVMSPEATVQKFDLNASGWDGEPGTPGYPHHRWMRKFVGLYATPPAGGRILDFGSGAGWCGIEAAKRAPGSSLCSFDPSPEMVRITGENANKSGVSDFTGRTGFGEDPPFPADGEEPYDLVISSGVISFSPDPERWLDGLARSVKPGGTLVIGDINGGSQGFATRRRNKPLLPVRELNAKTREEVRAGLEKRGFKFEKWCGYQLTRPIPQLMHLNETKMGGVLTYPLLWANQLSACVDSAFGSPFQARFDSWVMRFSRP